MYLRRSGNRTSRRQPSRSARRARRLTRIPLLLETLEPRRLLTTNDGGLAADLDINDPQIMVVQGEMTAPVAPVVSGSDLLTFYDYDTENSAASNTGYEASNRITFLFHEDPDQELGLVVLVDSPQDNEGGTVSLDIYGLDAATIVLADEPLEQTSSSDSTLFTRSWNAQASDGAAFNDLGENFSFTVEANYLFGIDGFDVVNGIDGSRVSIPLTNQSWEIYEEYGLEISAVPDVLAENSGSVTATITRGGAITEDLLVELQCSAASRVQLPQTVLIPAGSATAEFSVSLIDNTLPYDAQTIVLTASADHYRYAEASFDMIDDDLPLLDVGIEVALQDSNGTESSSGNLLTGTTATHVVHVTNTQNVIFNQPMVFGDNQTPGDSSDDFLFSQELNAYDTNVGDVNNNQSFDPGEIWQFTATTLVGAGQNLSQVYCGAIDPIFDVVLSPKVSAGYFGIAPSLALNIDSASAGENLPILAGDSMTTSYFLTNTGNAGLNDVLVEGASYVSGDTNADNVLDVDEVWSYTSSSEALAGVQNVSASVTARHASTDTEVGGAATGSYFGAVVAVSVAQTLDSSYVLSGDTVGVTYAVSNTGNAGLNDVLVEGASYVSGDTNADNVLDVDEVWSYTSSSEALAGVQNVSASVTARHASTDTEVGGAATGSYFGAVVAVSVAQTLDSSYVLSGDTVGVTYAVSNTGNAGLNDVLVEGASYVSGDTNADNVLDVDEVWSYTSSSEALAGVQNVSASVTARHASTDTEVGGAATGSYFGAVVAVSVAQTLDSSYVLSGDTVGVTYAVSNTGNAGLNDVLVEGASYVSGDTNADNVLDVDEVWSYTSSSEALAGVQNVSASVTARHASTDTEVGGAATGSYFGAVVAVSVAQTLDSSYVLSGDTVGVTYAVSNTGNAGLNDVLVEGASYVSGDTNADNVLDVDEVWSYTSSSEALAGVQNVSASVTARHASTDTEVGGAATGSYFGAVVAVSVAQTLDSSYVLSGDTVGVTYAVSNTGNAGLNDVLVEGASYVSGDTNADNVLDVDEVWSYTSSSEALAGVQNVSASVTARHASTDTEVGGAATGSYFGAVVDLTTTSEWDSEVEGIVPELIVGESFRIAYYLQNLGDIELADVNVAGANPVFSGPFVEGDLDQDGRIDPREIWKFERTGIVAAGDQSEQVNIVANTVDFDISLTTTLQDDYYGYYRSLAVTHTGDSGIGSLRYVLEDVASRPEGGVIYFDLTQDDPGFVDVDSDLPGGDAAADVFLIQPESALPPLEGIGPIEVIGGVNGIPVVIDGSLAGTSHGLEILSDGHQVKGLTIQNFALSGIRVLGTGNIIAGNKIGVDSAGRQAGNGGDGIWVEGGSRNLIGGRDEEGVDQNIIAYNGGNGISIENGTINQINTNAFYENAGMGIDLGRNGFTPNDIEDGFVDEDTGANELINTPVITRIELIGRFVEVDYFVPTNSDVAEESLRIEFYRADASRREGVEFLGTDLYTPDDFQRGGKTLTVDVDEYPDLDSRIVATATSSRAGTSEFSAPRGIRFAGRAEEEEQQDLADDVANGILAQLEAYLSGQTPTPAPTPVPGRPVITPNEPVHDVVVANSNIDEILIGRNVFAQDESDCALNVGSGEDPLVAIGFGEEVDEVTMAVNDYCVEQVYDLADSLSLDPGQMVAVIWFDPINFTVTIGDNQVSYDYDNNPTELAGSIPGASLVVTSASASTPGGVQGIMFAGDASTINVQMSTTSSGELMRGGVNIYTVGTGAGGTTIQPSIRTVFQGHLPGESVLMAFDPSAAPQLLARPSGVASQSMAGISDAASPGGGGGGGGGGIPGSIQGMFGGVDGFQLAFLDPASMANAALDIAGSTVEAGEEGSDVEDLENQVQEEFGTEASDEMEEEEDDLENREESDSESDDFDESPPGEEEEEIEESISGIFDILGRALASKSGQVDVLDILTQGSSTENHSTASSQDTSTSTPRWTHGGKKYEQMVSDHWARAFDARESEQTWTEALEAARKEG